MLTQLLDMVRQWRFWKHKRRRQRRRTLSSPSLWQGSDPQPSYLDLAVSTENLWLLEEELQAMQKNITRLLNKLSQQPDDLASSPDEECVVCVSGRSCMQTFPCGHRVLCRKCFIKTIQVAVCDRALPLRCVICRSKIIRLKHQPLVRRVQIRKQTAPPIYSPFSSGPSPHPPSGILQPARL